ncbi:amidohydrolase family protein [Polymorphobacter fuscus]|nr:amidohydrolase family protein [Polymorphobacter fuscus]NJC07736.1 imidazolonepropionase-like amidohydrolase [Polymorphobacter fuscus]
MKTMPATMFRLALWATVSGLAVSAASAATETFSVIMGGRNVGHLDVDTSGRHSRIDFDYKNNGRGPTMTEELDLDDGGLPVKWTISGATTFGSKVSENFALAGGSARWVDSTGPGEARVTRPSVYVAQSGSPWSLGLYARALLKAGGTLPALPGGTLKLTRGEALTVTGAGGAVPVTAYTVGGIETQPETILLDAGNALFAYITPDSIIVRKGYEGEEVRLRGLAEKWSTDRYVAIQKQVAHNYGAPVRIRNVRIFDPATGTLTAPMAVLVNGRTIAAVEPDDSPATPGEVAIDGAGGTLVAGLNEMHGHLGQDSALLNLAAGITTVRDMGNDNAVLDTLIDRMDAGIIGGPRVVRGGFLEGKSPFSANNGIVVDSEAAAVDAVRWYAARGYWMIKVYNSMNPAWVPAVVKEAHRLGLRVAGHVPAFATADQMIAAGYDEMTHINQFMLGWVIKPSEDTRTLFRLTALKRLPALDLQSAPVQRTIQLMVDGKKAIDPTVGIHENLLLNRDGKVAPGAVDYFDHMPVGEQRSLKKAWIDTSAAGDDAAYRGAYDQILKTVRMLHDRGVFIVPGTDTGGALTYHRELELLTQVGFTNAEVLKRATFDMAKYMGADQRLGSIEKGKLADFFLIPGDPVRDIKAIKSIAMVVKDGTFYYPAEIYPNFGIKPFAAAPAVTLPK